MSQQVTDPTLSLQELLQVQVQSLVQELPHAASAAKKKKKKKYMETILPINRGLLELMIIP